jgi:hypothetical protein
MNWAHILWPFVFINLLCGATRTVKLVFETQPGSSATLSGRLSGSPPGGQTITYTGSTGATVSFDSESLQPTSISFSNGRFFIEDFDFSFSGNAFVPGFGGFLVIVNVDTVGVEEFVTTPSPPGTILPDGSILMAHHQFITDKGRLILNARVPAFGEEETTITNFAQNPESIVGSGTASLSIYEESTNILERTLLFVIESEENTYQSEIIEGTTTSIILESTERIVAHARTTMPTAYGRWALDNSLHLSDGLELNRVGLPYSLNYAFNQPPESGTLPIRLRPETTGPPKVEITLPVSGLRMPLTAYYSRNLSPGSWVPLTDALLTGGSDNLGLGSTGIVEASFPEGFSGFIRFEAKP